MVPKESGFNQSETSSTYAGHVNLAEEKHWQFFLQIRHSSNTFGNSFFPTTAKEWNALPFYKTLFQATQ